jgi:predicted esterase
MRLLRRVLLVLLIALLLTFIAFIVWANTPPAPMQAALDALVSDASVTVATTPWITFTPTEITPTTGFIFYPGGRVDVRSYAPPLRQIAESGVLVVAVPMPLNLAVFGQNNADAVIQAYAGQIDRWVIGGHSLGGAMAGRYAYEHSDTIAGLVLWASFVEESYSLAGRDIAVASISGTLDGLATQGETAQNQAALPEQTIFVAIEGGNHAQFGDYGEQPGDNPAAITREEQQAQAVAATLALIERVNVP